MRYLGTWKVLDEMVADFRKKGKTIPQEIISDLKSARTLITVLKADTSHSETLQKVEGYLFTVESYLVSEGQKSFGTEYVETWLKRLDEASSKPFGEEEEESRFIPGLPRGQKWIRVKPTAELPLEKLKSLLEESHLSCTVQKDGYLLIHGEDRQILDFVKKMAAKHGLEPEK